LIEMQEGFPNPELANNELPDLRIPGFPLARE